MRLNGMPKQLLGGRLKEQYESARFMRKRRRNMPLIEYIPRRFSRSSQVLIDLANNIIEEYQGQGLRHSIWS